MNPDVTFVLCIENNAIRAQALLLCESIRTHGGRHRDARIVAAAPRPGLGIDAPTRRLLDAMDVEYVERPLNLACPEYGSANRVFAAAWAEAHTRSEWIVVLDSDTVFLGELELPSGADVAVRPVDVKGSATEGPSDPLEDYWTQLAAIKGVPLDCLPFVRTTVCETRVRASYNGGLVVVRREKGILASWADPLFPFGRRRAEAVARQQLQRTRLYGAGRGRGQRILGIQSGGGGAGDLERDHARRALSRFLQRAPAPADRSSGPREPAADRSARARALPLALRGSLPRDRSRHAETTGSRPGSSGLAGRAVAAKVTSLGRTSLPGIERLEELLRLNRGVLGHERNQ